MQPSNESDQQLQKDFVTVTKLIGGGGLALAGVVNVVSKTYDSVFNFEELEVLRTLAGAGALIAGLLIVAEGIVQDRSV